MQYAEQTIWVVIDEQLLGGIALAAGISDQDGVSSGNTQRGIPQGNSSHSAVVLFTLVAAISSMNTYQRVDVGVHSEVSLNEVAVQIVHSSGNTIVLIAHYSISRCGVVVGAAVGGGAPSNSIGYFSSKGRNMSNSIPPRIITYPVSLMLSTTNTTEVSPSSPTP